MRAGCQRHGLEPLSDRSHLGACFLFLSGISRDMSPLSSLESLWYALVAFHSVRDGRSPKEKRREKSPGLSTVESTV